jgi:hypothetical protein
VSQLVVRSIKHALWLIGTLLQNFGPAPAEAPVDANDPWEQWVQWEGYREAP